MASSFCHVTGVAMQFRLERIVRPQPRLRGCTAFQTVAECPKNTARCSPCRLQDAPHHCRADFRKRWLAQGDRKPSNRTPNYCHGDPLKLLTRLCLAPESWRSSLDVSAGPWKYDRLGPNA